MTSAIQLSSASHRRLKAVFVVLALAVASLLAISAQPAVASTANQLEGGGPFVPYIVGGQESSISQFPWQVYIVGRHEEGGETVEVTSCGGSILNATTILTAAHCVDHEGTTTTYAAGEFAVLAGASNVREFTEFVAATGFLLPPSGGQASTVSKIRTDPYYSVLPNTKDDVAVLTLSKSLELSAEKNAEPIGLVPAEQTPAPGTTLSISGYGKEEGAESSQPNGGLYSTTLTAISSDACREAVGVNSAVLLCAVSAHSSTCQGDSGGPLTEGNPAVEVGIVDFGAKECPVGAPDVFTNIAAPEIRDFIEGSESPPIAARLTSPAPSIKSVGPAPVALGPLTCEPGGWSGSPAFTYTFQAENGSGQVLQSGASDVFTPSTTAVGTPVVCIVQASNPGGVSTERSNTTAAIATDTTPPSATLGALTCHLQSCTLAFNATDPNGVALSEQPSAAYSVVVKCPKKKKKKQEKKGKKTRPPVCHKTLTVPMAISGGTGGAFQATISGLPYSEMITFIVDVSNAAGVKAVPLSATTTLRQPKPKSKSKHKKSKQHKKR
jgi:secreted trypsin-like serine protease